ncbi:MAG: Gfo/Idh/MocA family protein [Pirellulaceae bacterium]
MDRRNFLGNIGAAGMAASLAAVGAVAEARVSASNNISVAIMGVNGRGKVLTDLFAALPDVDIPYICEVDRNIVGPAMQAVEQAKKKAPKLVEDLRIVLDDKTVDAVVIATPVHWHAPATILACEAGKDVYVEKPMSHNVREGRLAVEAARRHERIVQVGSQSRSRPITQRLVEYLRSGKIGELLMAKVENTELRPDLGRLPDEPVPAGVNYDLWTGPVPMLPFNRNRFHRTYSWNWHYGAGELGDNGAHWLDICRWALDVDYPLEVSGMGRKLRFDDDKQSPDTDYISYNFDKKIIHWAERIWTPYGYQKSENTMLFYGTEGMLEHGRWEGGRYAFRVFDRKGDLIYQEQEQSPDEGIVPHIQNFVDCIRTREQPNADVEAGHISTTLCHLGNIVVRTGRNLRFDATTESIIGDPEATKLLTREYRDHWSSEPLRVG